MSFTLREFVLEVRSAETSAQEREIISRESANMRTTFKDPKNRLAHRNVVKCLFMHLIGYQAHFVKVEAVKLVASNKFYEKRLGYLILGILLDESDELLPLLPNSLHSDLISPNNFTISLALMAVSGIANADMYRQLLPDLEKCLKHPHTFIRKKAVLCSVQAIRKDSSFAEIFAPKIADLLGERSHAVVICSCALLLELNNLVPELIISRIKTLVQILVRALRALLMASTTAQHDVGGVTDPFLQVKLLQCIRALCTRSPDCVGLTSDVLAQIATNTAAEKSGTSPAASAVLYECVYTILAISQDMALRTLGVTTLLRFLSRRDNNSRYVALSLLSKVVFHDRVVIQRHRDSIIHCLTESDDSIRKRAMFIVKEMADATNTPKMFPLLLSHLAASDEGTKGEMTQMLCEICYKYFPSARWLIDAIMQILLISGRCVPEEAISALMAVILSRPGCQRFAVHRLFTYLIILRSSRAFNAKEKKTRGLSADADLYSLSTFAAASSSSSSSSSSSLSGSSLRRNTTSGSRSAHSSNSSFSSSSTASSAAQMVLPSLSSLFGGVPPADSYGAPRFPFPVPSYLTSTSASTANDASIPSTKHPLLSLASMKDVPIFESDEALLRIAVWCVGEYCELLVGKDSLSILNGNLSAEELERRKKRNGIEVWERVMVKESDVSGESKPKSERENESESESSIRMEERNVVIPLSCFDVVDVLSGILDSSSSAVSSVPSEIAGAALLSLGKIMSKQMWFGSEEEQRVFREMVLGVIAKYSSDPESYVQDTACEMMALGQADNGVLCARVMKRMPKVEKNQLGMLFGMSDAQNSGEDGAEASGLGAADARDDDEDEEEDEEDDDEYEEEDEGEGKTANAQPESATSTQTARKDTNQPAAASDASDTLIDLSSFGVTASPVSSPPANPLLAPAFSLSPSSFPSQTQSPSASPSSSVLNALSTSPATSTSTPPSTNKSDAVNDILRIMTSPAPSAIPSSASPNPALATLPMMATPMAVVNAPAEPSTVVYNQNGITGLMECKLGSPAEAQASPLAAGGAANVFVLWCRFTFRNVTAENFDRFVFQVACPKYITKTLLPVTATALLANSGNSIVQTIKLEHIRDAEHPTMLRGRIEFSSGGQQRSDVFAINSFPITP
ncbi:Adaptor protein complex 1 (AP-1), gamma subunit A [Monocercomonoides exilis]|uniref:Adaptor protein complex 1 (AP-1), gamma subunit A n=1 Tax=Monocercomonoides exilis TaxID=2049356 RepID=UPI00355A8DE3|nr:Adaptor protein complex 1 (AP-1), gamma subunit A [Monocercomonoides exilis]